MLIGKSRKITRISTYAIPNLSYANQVSFFNRVDIYNRLYRERIIFLGSEIDDELANQIIGVMLYLDSEDNTKPIYLYINCPGGSVIAGLAIYDCMNHIKSEVVTINLGLAASMASFILSGGSKGKRLALPSSRIMIHHKHRTLDVFRCDLGLIFAVFTAFLGGVIRMFLRFIQ